MSVDFDQLAVGARSGTMESNNSLWSAVFALDRWWCLPAGDPPRPRIGIIDGKQHVLAFTSGERARQQAQAWGLAAPDGSIDVIAMTPQGVLGTIDSMRAAGIFGIVFDQGITGFFAPLENLLPIYEHVRHLIVEERPVGGWYTVYQGQEYRVELLDYAVLLPGIGQPVPMQQLTELYAINLIANIGSAECGVVAQLGDRLRLMTGQPDPETEPSWQLADRGVYESVVEAADVQTEVLRTDLPLSPTAAPLIMQKVLTPAQTRAVFDGRLRHIAGYVTRMDDVLHLRTPVEVIHQLQLLYPGSPFAADAETVAVLRFPLRDGTWRLENTEPASIPQYFVGSRRVMPMPVGAELQVFGRDGNQHVAMRYAGTTVGWQHL